MGSEPGSEIWQGRVEYLGSVYSHRLFTRDIIGNGYLF
jgi:hypothetical protein